MAHMNAHGPPLYRDHQDLLPRPGSTDLPISLDPVAVLPPEVSSQCIREALDSGRKDPAQILAFSTVSCRWQDLICSTPSLWRRIHIDSSMPDLLATITTFSQLSTAVPIDLVFWTEPDAHWNHITSLLTPHIQRIRSLTFGDKYNWEPHEPRADLPTLSAVVSFIMNSLGSLPGLQVLDFGTNGPIDSPNLKLISLPPDARIYCGIIVLSTLLPSEDNRHLTHVTRIVTKQPLGSFIVARGALKRLSEIVFMDGGPINSDMDGPRVFDTSEVFTALTSLSYYQEYNVGFKSLLDQTGPQLLRLRLSIPAFEVLGMVTRLSKLARLQYLELDITDWGRTGQFYSVNCAAVIHGLRGLSLRKSSGGTRSIEPLHSIAFGALFGAFISMYPGVKQIHFSDLSDILRFAGTYVEGLASLETLSLRDIEPKPTSHSQICLPRLRNLVIDDFNGLTWVLTPEIRGLDVREAWDWNAEPLLWKQPHNFRQLTIQSLHNSVHLVIDGHLDLFELDLWSNTLTRRWDLSRHHRLVHIRLSSSMLMNNHGNDLCEEIIYSPESCPLLGEIEFSHFVDWDLLFIMLERRNIGNPECKMIRKVTIPYVPFALCHSLHQLLQGIAAKRPSNIELSLEATREVICDPRIPGCLLCIKYMVPECKKEVERVKPIYPLPFKDLFRINTRPSSKLPPEVLSWMLRRRRLVEDWIASYSCFQSEFYRKECCYARRHDGGGMIMLYHQWDL